MTSTARFDNWQNRLGTQAGSIDASGNVTFDNDVTVTGDITQGGVLMPSAAELNDFGVWTIWTPEWTAYGTNPSIGNGILNGRYAVINDQVIAQYEVRMGSTTTYGSGIYRFSYPVAANTSSFFVYADVGFGRLYDASAGFVTNVHAIVDGGSSTTFVLGTDGASAQVGATHPYQFAIGDEILMTVVYRAA